MLAKSLSASSFRVIVYGLPKLNHTQDMVGKRRFHEDVCRWDETES